jgi:hypothetical protein
MVLIDIEVSALYRAEEELKDANVEILSNPIDVYKAKDVQALQGVPRFAADGYRGCSGPSAQTFCHG